jgi:hypothetical protein
MARVKTFINKHGQYATTDVVSFMVFSPSGSPIYRTCRRSMKDACMAFEDEMDRDWDEIAAEGYRVMKLFSSGYDRTDQALLSIDNWVVEVSPGD